MPENERDRVAAVVKYIENMDLLRWDLPDVEAFSIGIKDMRAKLNSVINPNVFEQVCFQLMVSIVVCALVLVLELEWFLSVINSF